MESNKFHLHLIFLFFFFCLFTINNLVHGRLTDFCKRAVSIFLKVRKLWKDCIERRNYILKEWGFCNQSKFSHVLIIIYVFLVLSSVFSEPMWPIEARNAAIANSYFTCAINRVGTVR